MLTEHVTQRHFLRGAMKNVNPQRRGRSGALLLCALALLAGCANQSGNRAPVTDLNSGSTAVARTYVIKPGDTLNKIASQYRTSVKSIKSKNNLKSDIIISGQRLKI